MLKDVLTNEELYALIGETAQADANAAGLNQMSQTACEALNRTSRPDCETSNQPSQTACEDTAGLVRALIRNQLRLIHMIGEMQSELRSLRAMVGGSAAQETAAGAAEPIPFPFLKQPPAAREHESFPEPDRPTEAAADLSRKDRFKRKSFW